jgi:hypothetical protein
VAEADSPEQFDERVSDSLDFSSVHIERVLVSLCVTPGHDTSLMLPIGDRVGFRLCPGRSPL